MISRPRSVGVQMKARREKGVCFELFFKVAYFWLLREIAQ